MPPWKLSGRNIRNVRFCRQHAQQQRRVLSDQYVHCPPRNTKRLRRLAFQHSAPAVRQHKRRSRRPRHRTKLAFAYLAERLFTIYLRYGQQTRGLRIKEFPFALASDFFEPPAGKPFIILKTPQWQDIFIDQQNNRICSFNNPYRSCGKFSFLPQNRLQVNWDNGGVSYFRHSGTNVFELEK